MHFVRNYRLSEMATATNERYKKWVNEYPDLMDIYANRMRDPAPWEEAIEYYWEKYDPDNVEVGPKSKRKAIDDIIFPVLAKKFWKEHGYLPKIPNLNRFYLQGIEPTAEERNEMNWTDSSTGSGQSNMVGIGGPDNINGAAYKYYHELKQKPTVEEVENFQPMGRSSTPKSSRSGSGYSTPTFEDIASGLDKIYRMTMSAMGRSLYNDDDFRETREELLNSIEAAQSAAETLMGTEE